MDEIKFFASAHSLRIALTKGMLTCNRPTLCLGALLANCVLIAAPAAPEHDLCLDALLANCVGKKAQGAGRNFMECAVSR